MPSQDPATRIKNFNSVTLGLTKEQALAEAKRCLQCKKPLCIKGCPVEIDIPGFIKLIAGGEFDQAALKLKEKNNLPAICGRVCPQETQCEIECVLIKKSTPIAIGALERFAADWKIQQPSANSRQQKTKSNNIKVAVVGSGPAGLTCAADLARIGYSVTIFESLHKPGGVLVYGIPEFRLPKATVDVEIDYIKSLGVEIQENMLIGNSLSLDDLFKESYKAIFIAVGAGLPQFMGVSGESLGRVYSANEFLTRVNLMKAYLFPEYDTPVAIGKRVAVIGGGNVAFDSARCALRLGAEKVFIVYRRTENEMPARHEEIENAKEEGIEFKLLTQPVEILSDTLGCVSGMKCLKMQLGEPDESGRRRPVAIKGSEFNIDIDCVVVAIGQNPNPLLPRATPELETGKNGIVVTDSNTQATNIKGVYAGGDITTGAATVISAMGAGKKAAKSIDQYLNKL